MSHTQVICGMSAKIVEDACSAGLAEEQP